MLAIVIDDLGNDLSIGRKIIDLPAALTLSILPHTPAAVRLANEGHLRGREIMVHLPMSNTRDLPLGPGALKKRMLEEEFNKVLRKDIAAVPFAQGVNNHMGSDLTQRWLAMGWLMDGLGEFGFYFVDSLTSPKSVAWEAADFKGIPWLKRDIFLDAQSDRDFIAMQYQKAINQAYRKGWSLVIAHPYPTTIEFLQRELPHLASQNVKTVTVSELFNHLGILISIDQ